MRRKGHSERAQTAITEKTKAWCSAIVWRCSSTASSAFPNTIVNINSRYGNSITINGSGTNRQNGTMWKNETTNSTLSPVTTKRARGPPLGSPWTAASTRPIGTLAAVCRLRFGVVDAGWTYGHGSKRRKSLVRNDQVIDSVPGTPSRSELCSRKYQSGTWRSAITVFATFDIALNQNGAVSSIAKPK